MASLVHDSLIMAVCTCTSNLGYFGPTMAIGCDGRCWGFKTFVDTRF